MTMDWLMEWLNSNKSKVLHIHSSHIKATKNIEIKSHTHLCLHNHNRPQNCNCPALEQVRQYTYLGLIIDHRFNWKHHINSVCNKLRAILANFELLINVYLIISN